MALAEMGFGLNGIGRNGYWPIWDPIWELDQVALDEMALDEMGLDEVGIPQHPFRRLSVIRLPCPLCTLPLEVAFLRPISGLRGLLPVSGLTKRATT